MAFSRDDLEIAEQRVAQLRESVTDGQRRLVDLARRGEPTEAAETAQLQLVETLGRMIDHVAAVRLSVARRQQAGTAPPRQARRA
jgi:hypothetical protein